MQVQFLGTAAAEGWPALFCECDACVRARALGGKNVRTRSSVNIGENFKVDWPPDTYLHVLQHGLNLSRVQHLFITHSHYDHFSPPDFLMRMEPFAHMKDETPLHVYGNLEVLKRIRALERNPIELNLALYSAEPFNVLEVDRFRVTPLLADHSPDEVSLIYLFESGGKTILHGYDSGWFPEETWDALRGYTLDLAILDCTYGPSPGMKYHMGIDGVLKTKERMLSEQIADKDTAFVATHFSHNGGLLHEELASKLGTENVQVAFDGLTIRL